MHKLYKKISRTKNTRGDLIIEIILAIVIIGIVLTAGYVLSNRGLNSSTNSEKRSQAQAIAQGQVERMASTEKSAPAELAKYLQSNFCITTNGTIDVEDVDNPANVCPNYDGDIGVGVTYNDVDKTFTVNAKWNVASGDPVQDRDNLTYKDQVTVYYKLPANFNSSDIALSAYVRGNGKITSSPIGINCGNDCTEAYPAPAHVTLTATPSSGSSFNGWSGACSGISTTCELNVNTLMFVAANFEPTGSSSSTSSTSTSSSSGGGIQCKNGVPAQDKNGNWYCKHKKPPPHSSSSGSSSGSGSSSSNGNGGGGGGNGSGSQTGGGGPRYCYTDDVTGQVHCSGSSPGGCPSGCGCFVAGTLVDTDHGRFPIEEIKVGDTVQTWDTRNWKMVYSKVTDREIVHRAPTLWLVTSGGSVTTTAGHLFWTPSGYVKAGDLAPGASLYTDEGELVKVVSSFAGTKQDVYNFHVASDNHNYFANGILVHNISSNL